MLVGGGLLPRRQVPQILDEALAATDPLAGQILWCHMLLESSARLAVGAEPGQAQQVIGRLWEDFFVDVASALPGQLLDDLVVAPSQAHAIEAVKVAVSVDHQLFAVVDKTQRALVLTYLGGVNDA